MFDFYVNWKLFVDIEEFGVGKYYMGISYYEVIIGMFSVWSLYFFLYIGLYKYKL